MTKEGIEYEADQRHAELIIREMGLKEDSNSVNSPGAPDSKEMKEQDWEEEADGDNKLYRAIATWAIYLGQDRMDIQFAAKAISRFTRAPEKVDWARAKRLARYLVRQKRLITDYKFQKMPTEVVIWSDSDHAGCWRTRKSTSGGVMFGGHCVKSYSSTQPVIALSPGEAEYYVIVKAGTMGIGVWSLFADLGIKVTIRINTDSDTAKSIASRRGAGKVRHIETQEMWVQEKVAKKDTLLKKIW